MPEDKFTIVPRLGRDEGEPAPTEEDLRRHEEMLRQMGEERRAAIEAGERLPPIRVNLWKTED